MWAVIGNGWFVEMKCWCGKAVGCIGESGGATTLR